LKQERHRPITGGPAGPEAPALVSLVLRAHNLVARSPLRVACDIRPVKFFIDPLLEMRAADVLTVGRAVAGVTEHWWVAGGWGVDALMGRQTRRHRDLDMIVGANQREVDAMIAALADLGLHYLAQRRSRRSIAPRRLWLADSAGHSVDLLPVDLDVAPFRAAEGEPAAFGIGVIAGEQVPCVSAALQVQHHRHYQQRSTDRHDMNLLDADAQPSSPERRAPW
jgi:lincosamide nucleotidyltransferase A/C/D/E